MVQLAAALLFAVAAGLGITVILAMLKNNETAILSALLGEGAFPIIAGPATGPANGAVPLHRPYDAPRRSAAAACRPDRPSSAQPRRLMRA